MIGKLHTVVLDTRDMEGLAKFYGEALGLRVLATDDDWIDIGDDSGIVLSFQLAPDHQPPDWPDPNRPQQFHLDIRVDDIEVAHPAILALGARFLADGTGRWRVYADPSGHPFCLEWD